MTPKPKHGGAMTPDEFRAARLALGLTQTELGQILDLSKNEISRKECGRRTISQSHALAVRGLLAMRGLDSPRDGG